MLYLTDEGSRLFKATFAYKPNLESQTKWFSCNKYIDGLCLPFYFTKSGSCFYFEYNYKWYRVMKRSLKHEEITEYYTTITVEKHKDILSNSNL